MSQVYLNGRVPAASATLKSGETELVPVIGTKVSQNSVASNGICNLSNGGTRLTENSVETRIKIQLAGLA